MTVNDAGPILRSPHAESPRRRLRVLAVVALLVALVASGCVDATIVDAEATRSVPEPQVTSAHEQASDAGDEPTVGAPTASDTTASPQPVADDDADDLDPADQAEAVPTPDPTAQALAAADTELPGAPIGFDSLFDNIDQGPKPVTIAIDGIRVQDAPVIPVGVNEEDLSFEVPPADQVGWYEFGPAPGEPGSAVLAAHIAYNGVDGVFRYLEDVEVGAVVTVGFDDGSTQRYRIETVTEYIKEELPDSLFDRDGRQQLALITCGGAFNYQLDSYESNTVAVAVPI